MAKAKKEASKEVKKEVKSRYWAAEVYPDSAPSDWRDIIKISGLVAAISPIHDKDVNPTGERKKPHYHIILAWDGPTTLSNARRFVMEKLNGPTPFELKSIRGMYNYFTHKDNPEKYQYDEKDIEHINNFCLSDFVELTRGEVDRLIKEVMRLIREVDITEYSGLLDFLDDNGMNDEWDVAKNNAFLFNTYLCSRRNSERREVENFGRVELARAKARTAAKLQSEKSEKSRNK